MTAAELAGAAPVLQAGGLVCAHPGAATLLDGVSLQVAAGEVVALLGGSGCGKSSLLRLLAGLATPQAGTLRFLGAPLTAPHPRAALLFQQPSLLPWLRVQGNVAFGLGFTHQPRLATAERAQRVDSALADVGLPQAARLWPAQLSGGMAQRVALARALARQPALLLADEPFSALDAITRAEMQALLLDVVRRHGTAVLLVTHDLDEALAVADRVCLIGPQPAPGTANTLRAQWTLPPLDQADARQALRPALRAALQQALLDARARPAPAQHGRPYNSTPAHATP